MPKDTSIDENANKVDIVDKVITRITALIFTTLVIVFAFREIYSPDIGFHLRAGEWIIQNLKVPAQDTFTYTSSAHDYVDMHWLYQVVIAAINKISGDFGLVASHAFLLVLSFFILYLRSDRKQKINKASNWHFIFFLAITSASVLFEPRPHILSWLIFTLMLLILEEYDRGRGKFLFLLPLLMLIWTNTHTLFILGWIVLGCYLVGIAFRDRKIWTPLTKYAILSIIVSFLNPYFSKGVALPFVQFQLLQPHNVFKDAIAELTSPINLDSYFFNSRFVFLQPLMWFHAFLILSVISFIRRLKQIQLHDFLIYGLFLYLAVSSVRNIGFFVLAVLPATIEGLQPKLIASEDETNKKRGIRRILHLMGERRGQSILDITTIGVTLVLILAIVTDVYYINYRSHDRFGYRFNEHVLPVRAAKFLTDNNLDGKVLNHFNFGGYLIYALPQKIFIDGRTEVMGEEFFYKYSILWNQVDKSPILQKYDPDIIIFPHQNDFLWIHYLRKDSLWRLVYVDELAVVYLKTGYADDIPHFNSSKSLAGYGEIDDAQTDEILKKDYPSGLPLVSFTKQYFPLTELGLSTFYYYNDQFDEAIHVGINGLLRTTVACPEMYYNLGHYFFEKRDFERSIYCYERFLKTNNDELARHRSKMIRSGRIQVWEDK
ncbi:MAG: hypothetical protein HY800_09780 [Ignavibacteriales bacterium]|nr:hypothetical protein [Ignavibacteriales bacterium]